ncbi:hypothetical protein G7Y89_g2427 [Cudoniella acicularis]|uniref:Uncharacterized protein n=1 Tax=Cudoniella acicularis TaxID=354080 RepID=A0A8H4RTB3_9HELO|nr:hypothetical protein G7Y89_g2427 [Cudoniella acicularis]
MYSHVFTTTCGDPFRSSSAVVDTILFYLCAFVEPGHAPALERLRVIKWQFNPSNNLVESFNVLVRLDVHNDTSRPITVFPCSIGGFRQDSWLARLPEEEGGDFVSFPWVLGDLAEGPEWQESERGVRIPAPIMAESTVYQAVSPALTGDEFRKQFNMSCRPWVDEDKTGYKIPTEKAGDLLKKWEIREMIPEGWRRV